MTQKFVLIHSPQGIEDARVRLATLQPPSNELAAEALDVGSFVTAKSKKKSATANPARRPSREVAHVKVGIWSLGAWLGSLTELIAALNGAQSTFVFYEVEAAVPSGLVSRPERMTAWLAEAFGDDPDDDAKRKMAKARKDIQDNLIAHDFFGLGDRVRTDFGLDYLIGITPSMVAGIEDGRYYWNHFSTFEGRTVLASSYELHQFARASKLPFDAFLSKIIVSQLLVAMFWPKLSFHNDTGCLFDYDASRVSLIDKVRAPKIDPACHKKIPPEYHSAVDALVNLLDQFRR